MIENTGRAGPSPAGNAPDPLARIAERLRADPRQCGVFLDFDGVLAPIQDEPSSARPLPELVEHLHVVSRTVGRLCIVSGRPVRFLAQVLGDLDGDLYGAYGLQWRVGGSTASHPSVQQYESTLAAILDDARENFPELVIEDKGVSMTVHFRTRPWARLAVESWAAEQSLRSGMRLLDGRMVVELAMPIQRDKGDVVAAALDALTAAVYVGDDLGDLPALRAIRDVAATRPGFAGLGIAVLNDAPVAEVVGLTDVQVDSPRELVTLLRQLVPPT